MAKNNKKHQTLSLRAMPLEELIRFARENFDKGNLRIARDAYKELVRIDKTQFLAELLICYNQMAKQMIENQQINEAKMLIELIKELGGEKAVTVSLDSTGKIDHTPEIAMLSLEKILSSQKIPEDLKFKAADWAIAKGELPKETYNSFLSDFNAISSSLACLCSRDFDQCAGQLKSISFDSPFSQWKLLVRGMISYYTGDDNKAEIAFSKIVPDTVPSKIAKAYLVLVNHSHYLTKTDSDREETIKNVCVLSGHAELKECLPRAHYFWMTKRYRDSLIHMQTNCASFPTIDQSIAGTLTNFYYNSVHTFTDKDLSKYLPALYNINKHPQAATGFQKVLLLTEFLAERSHGNFLLKSADEPPEELLKTWERCYKSYRSISGNDPLLESEIYLKLGSEYLLDATEQHVSDPFMDHDTSQVESLAETCLQKSLELSKSKEAYILLMQFYRNSERKKDCRVLIENATKDFPSDKELLIEAGQMARSRDAYTKAIEYLERAYEIDKIDSDLRKLLVMTFIESAKKVPKSKYGLTRMRSYLSRAEQLCTAGSQGFLDEPAYIKIRRAGLEFLHGNEIEGNNELQLAYDSPIDPLKLDFFSLFVFKSFGVPPPCYKKLYSNVQMVLFAPAKIDKAMTIMQVVSFVRNFPDSSMFREDFNRIFTYVTDAFKKCTFTPHDVRTCYALAEEMKYTSTCKSIVEYALKSSPDNPLYHFYKYKNKNKKKPGDNYNRQKIASDKTFLESLISSALNNNDLETVTLIRKELESLAHNEANLPKVPFPFDPSMNDFGNAKKGIFDLLLNPDFDDFDDCDGDCANCDHCDEDDFYPPERKKPARRKKTKQKR
ncbi:MAG TPA: hypothetical protein VHO70_11360 [Chitinispirillaceae bacterium]|nr:hypothetical protein [Chitinispirillaceae bacterium]